MVLDSQLHWGGSRSDLSVCPSSGLTCLSVRPQLVVLDSLLHWGGVLDELDLAQRLHGWRDRGLAELADARRPAADLHVVRAIDTAGFTETPHTAARRAAHSSPSETDDGCLPLALICGKDVNYSRGQMILDVKLVRALGFSVVSVLTKISEYFCGNDAISISQLMSHHCSNPCSLPTHAGVTC